MKYLLITLLISLFVVTALAEPPELALKPLSTAKTNNIDTEKYISCNNILMFSSNVGIIARDMSNHFVREDGFYYPFTGDTNDYVDGSENRTVVNSAGIWLCGKVNDSLRTALATFGNLEFNPGPMNYIGPAGDTTKHRVYYIDNASSAGDPDYDDWPSGDGAPVDGFGNPALKGDAMMWCLYNDDGPHNATSEGGGTEPLGIEVHQTIWGYKTTSAPYGDILYLEYKLYNKGENNIDSFYIAFWADPDNGWVTDDLVGVDTADQIFFSYNADNDDDIYGSTPPAWGGMILYGPVVSDPGETAIFDGHTMANYRNMRMTAFNKYLGGADPAMPEDVMQLMVGINHLTDEPYVDPGTGDTTMFPLAGDPVAGTGWIDSNPADRRLFAAFGPLNFNPGDSQYVAIILGCQIGADRLASVSDLKSTLKAAAGGFPTSVPTGSKAIPDDFELAQNHPNPFNSSTRIDFALKTRTDVSITVFNLLGQKLYELLHRSLPAGNHSVTWDGKDAEGNEVASGIYFYQIKSDDFSATKKMIYMK